MIFNFSNNPIDLSDPKCIVKGFNNETTPEIFEKAVAINEMRNNFFYFFKNLKDDKSFSPSYEDFIERINFIKQYLNFIEYGLLSNYNFKFSFKLFINAQEGAGQNSGLKDLIGNLLINDESHLIFNPNFTLDKNLMMSHIVHVYTFFLGTLSHSTKMLNNHVNGYLIDGKFNLDFFNIIQQIYKLGFGRLLKFILVRDSVLGLYVCDGLPEDFSIGLLDIFKQVYMINYIHLLLYKALFSNDSYKGIVKSFKLLPVFIIWINEGVKIIKNFKQILSNCLFNWKTRLLDYLNRLNLYFELLLYSFILRYNNLMEEEKTISLESSGKLLYITLYYIKIKRKKDVPNI